MLPTEEPGRLGPRTTNRQPMVLHTRVITGQGGGPDKTILNSPRFLATLGYRSVCAFLRPPHDKGFQAIRQRAEQWHAPIEEIEDRNAIDLRALKRLLGVCRRLDVDIWHAHDYKTNLFGLLLRRLHPMRLVTTCHGWVEHTSRTKLYYRVDRWSLPRYERVICVSEDLVNQCRKQRVADDKLVLIENAIDTDEYCRSIDVVAAKQKLNFPAGRFLLGAAGRLSPEKAFDDLIRAVGELVRRGVDLGLFIAGDGPQRDALQRLIDELKLQDRVRLLGFQGDLRPFYQSLDLFVLSSLREGLPNVMLEAMALEVPVVATRIAGIPRVISDGENGLLVDPSDLAGLTHAIGQALGSASLRERLSVAGRRTVDERYSFAARMKKIAAIYDDLLSRHNGQASRP
ncbi:MAG: glycosyltransferase family 4 protein [Pirellulales bacterium]